MSGMLEEVCFRCVLLFHCCIMHNTSHYSKYQQIDPNTHQCPSQYPPSHLEIAIAKPITIPITMPKEKQNWRRSSSASGLSDSMPLGSWVSMRAKASAPARQTPSGGLMSWFVNPASNISLRIPGVFLHEKESLLLIWSPM